MEKIYKTSEAKRRNNAKYDAKTYRTLPIKAKKEFANAVDEYIKMYNYKSRNSFVINCIKYCIDNNIDVFTTEEQTEEENKEE